jgi:hypothetical protein
MVQSFSYTIGHDYITLLNESDLCNLRHYCLVTTGRKKRAIKYFQMVKQISTKSTFRISDLSARPIILLKASHMELLWTRSP